MCGTGKGSYLARSNPIINCHPSPLPFFLSRSLWLQCIYLSRLEIVLSNANVMMTIGFALILFALFNFVLGDDIVGGLGAATAAVDAGEVLLNGLLQVTGAPYNAGQALGQALGGAAVDFFSGSQDTTAGSHGTTAGSNTIPPATDGSASDVESLLQNPNPAPNTADPAVPVSAPIEPQKEGSNDNPDIEIDVFGDREPSKTALHDDCDSENIKASLRAWTKSQKVAEMYNPPCHRMHRIPIPAVSP